MRHNPQPVDPGNPLGDMWYRNAPEIDLRVKMDHQEQEFTMRGTLTPPMDEAPALLPTSHFSLSDVTRLLAIENVSGLHYQPRMLEQCAELIRAVSTCDSGLLALLRAKTAGEDCDFAIVDRLLEMGFPGAAQIYSTDVADKVKE